MPVGEQLGQVKEAAKGKINEFVDQANLKFDQAKNDPSNKYVSLLSFLFFLFFVQFLNEWELDLMVLYKTYNNRTWCPFRMMIEVFLNMKEQL